MLHAQHTLVCIAWLYTHTHIMGKVLTLTLLLNVCLEQVQSIDYTGDEVQVTTTDGIGYSAQKVGAGVLLG